MRQDRWRAGALAALVVAFGLLLARPAGGDVTRAIDSLSPPAAAILATGAALWRAARLRRRARASWAVMAAAFGAAAVGEAISGWYELVADQSVPSPSAADAAYLTFPVLALLALLLRPSSALGGQRRLRTVLDGLLVAGCLLSVSWVTVLGAVYGAGGTRGLAFAVHLAYPVTDVVLVTVTLVLLGKARTRRGLGPLAAGLAALALSDSGYWYLKATQSQTGANLIDIGYFAGFLLLAEAALRDRSPDQVAEGGPESLLSMLLPYLPAAVGIGIAGRQTGPFLDNPAVVVGRGLVALLFIRQLLILADNRALVHRVLAQREELIYQAFHDPLTSLANRAMFNDRLGHAVELHRRDGRPLVVLMADLDDFKSVNDSLGHSAGDQLLLRVAERWRAGTRAGDTVARLGGDEFAVLVEDGADALGVAEQLLRALDQPIEIGSLQVPMSASIGAVVLGPHDSPLDAAELLKRADLAMYAAKRAGKRSARLYDEGNPDQAVNELDLLAELVMAVTAGDLRVHYQPIVSVEGTLLGFEALSRWSRQGADVPPDVFIPAAERAGVLTRLDEQVLASALAFATVLNRTGRQLFMAVNAGVEQLTDPTLADRLASLVESHGLTPTQLVIEVPENRRFTDMTAVGAAVAELRARGVQLALDDFGTGWSSLARMQALRPDIVKIDRCFIAPLETEGASTDLVAGMIELAHRVGATVIAEGVEHPRQRDVLRDLGCDALQGFLVGRPMAAQEATLLVTSTLDRPPPQGRRQVRQSGEAVS